MLAEPVQAAAQEIGRLRRHDVAEPVDERVDRARARNQGEEAECDEQHGRDREEDRVGERRRDQHHVVVEHPLRRPLGGAQEVARREADGLELGFVGLGASGQVLAGPQLHAFITEKPPLMVRGLATADLEQLSLGVVDLERRVLDREALVEDPLELPPDRVAVGVGVDEHMGG